LAVECLSELVDFDPPDASHAEADAGDATGA